MLEEFSDAVAAVGHPETRYGLWKVDGEQSGDYQYMFGSLWADRGTYDAVHQTSEYLALQQRHREAFVALVGDEVTNHYGQIAVQYSAGMGGPRADARGGRAPSQPAGQ